MVKKASSKIEQCGLGSRIEIVHGGVGDILQEDFDGATSLLVAHFIPKEEKEKFIKEISFRLKPGAKFIIADVCNDRNSRKFEDFLSVWESFQLQTREKKEVEEMFKHARQNFYYITVEETITLLSSCGFTKIQHFWKSLLINGFVMEKIN
jgi:tRNA (cmo5U34)-methyltransferase